MSNPFPMKTAATDSLPIIDTHQHLWDFAHFRPPWLENAKEPLGKSHTLAEYQRAAHGLNIAATVYMEVDVAERQQADEAAYVTDLCRRADFPMRAAVIGGRPASSDFAAYLKQVRSPFIKGVRQVLHGGTAPGYCLTDDFVRGIQLLGERNLLFDLCLRPEELSDGAALAQRCPDTRFIVDHCGNAPVNGSSDSVEKWRRGMAALAACPNIAACKISGIVAQLAPGLSVDAIAQQLAPRIQTTLDSLGPDRVIWASDWPVCTLAAPLSDWLRAAQQIAASRPETEQRKLFAENARRIYALE